MLLENLFITSAPGFYFEFYDCVFAQLVSCVDKLFNEYLIKIGLVNRAMRCCHKNSQICFKSCPKVSRAILK